MSKDLTEMRFGKLIALYPTDQRNKRGYVLWHCCCDCGKTVDVPSCYLTEGRKKSCGCLGKPDRKSWTGKTFSYLTVLSYAYKKDGSHYWHCRCRCGKEVDVRQSNLQSGHTTSCGCIYSANEKRHFVNGTCIESITSEKISKNNTSGVKGVYLNKRNGKWVAQITLRGKKYHLGTFDHIGDAEKARKEAEQKMFGPIVEAYSNNREKK